jgi:uncharacterized membrane protein
MRETMLILHFIGLSMGLGTSFAHAFLGIATAKMSPEEVIKFRVHSLVLSNMGNVGLGLLVVSGLYLITPYWSILTSLPLLMGKLVLVVVLTILILMINTFARRARNGDAEFYLKKMEKLGKMTLIIALTIVVLAVCVFH